MPFSLKSKLFWLQFLALSIWPRLSPALNPVAAVTAAEKIDEVLDTGEAAIDLMYDSSIDESLVQELESNVKRLEKINRGIKDTKYVSEQVKELSEFDLSRSKSMAEKMRYLSSKIKHGKRVSNLLSGGKVRPAMLQVEQVKLSYRMLDELRNIRLYELNKMIEERERKVQTQIIFEKVLKEESQNRRTKWQAFRAKKGQRL